jgi:hypothetical protein
MLRFHELQEVTTDHRYADCRAALSEVQGIYLVTDSSTGRQYVAKADGGERILRRWMQYARDGHGSNVALREFAAAASEHGGPLGTDRARHSCSASCACLVHRPLPRWDAAESHYKNALMT